VSDEGWEARMAERARQRREEREAWAAAEAGAQWQRVSREDQRRIAATWTLGEEAELRRGPLPACACLGPPWCCINRAEVGDRLCHQAVRLAGAMRAVVERKGSDHGE
jgi:hypothetical protein